jgi:cytochrome c-type biogenesis protein CcmH/NrfG
MRILFIAAIIMAMLMATGCNNQQDNTPITQQGPTINPLQMDKKIKGFKGILKTDPKNLSALIGLGNAYMDTNRFGGAIEAYTKAIEIDPGNINVLVDLGTSHRRNGRSDLAVEAYRKALIKDPAHTNANLNLGVVLLYDFNDLDGAQTAFENFIKAAPNNPNAPAIKGEIQRIKEAKSSGGR